MSWLEISIGVSELLAIVIIWKLWKSDDFLIFKVVFSAIAFVPFLGPFIVLWSSNIPPRQHPDFQDRSRFTTDVLDRWRHVFDEKNPQTKFRMWQQMGNNRKNDRSS